MKKKYREINIENGLKKRFVKLLLKNRLMKLLILLKGKRIKL
jgi:hypothetical protein